MADRDAKAALFGEFAAVGKVLGSPSRLELLDLLAQGERSVDELATVAHLRLTTCSAHLQTLREAGLVTARREGKRVFYALASDDVAGLWEHLRRVAVRHRPHTDRARRAYLGPEDVAAVDTPELLRRLHAGQVVVLDVRPAAEYAAGHLPGARHLPLEQLPDRLDELPAGAEVVAYCRGRYCVLAHEAVRLLRAHGFPASRAEEGVLEWRAAGQPLAPGAA